MADHGAVLDVVIVEDEDRARHTLRSLLDADADVRVVAETAGAQAPDVIRARQPDLIFLDVQMPGMDGFEVLRRLDPERMPVIVFVTAYDEYALEAFSVAAADYLLKPFSDSRFREALDRAKRRARDRERAGDAEVVRAVVRAMRQLADTPPRPEPDRLLVRDAGRSYLLAPKDVDWIEANGPYVRIHSGQRSLLIRESLGSMEERLSPHGFFRIHRSALVNLDRIHELRHRSHGDYLVVLRDGTELTLSRTRREELERRLGGSLS